MLVWGRIVVPLMLVVTSCGSEVEVADPVAQAPLRAVVEPVLGAAELPAWREIQVELDRGQTVAAALLDQGLSTAAGHEVVSALRPLVDFRRIRPGAEFIVSMAAEDDRVEHVRFATDLTDVVEAERGPDGELAARRVQVDLDLREVVVEVTIQDSLYQALDTVGEGPELATLLSEVFAWDIDFYRDQHPGDRFRVLVEKQFSGDEMVRYGRVLAAEYSGKVGTLRTFWFAPNDRPETGDYYLEDGRSARKFFLATPLEFTRVSSRFSYSRRHPVLGYNTAHLGVDYAARRGTPVRAMAAGKVIFAGYKGANGNLVKVRHRAGLVSMYAHLHKIAPGIRSGTTVKQKQVIGRVGSTGRATGPHLHFAVQKNGKFVNPAKLEMSRMDPVPPGRRGAFERVVAERLERLANATDSAAVAIAQSR